MASSGGGDQIGIKVGCGIITVQSLDVLGKQ